MNLPYLLVYIFAVAKIIATALVGSTLDYCSSLYHNIALKDTLKLQRVQNILFHLVKKHSD